MQGHKFSVLIFDVDFKDFKKSLKKFEIFYFIFFQKSNFYVVTRCSSKRFNNTLITKFILSY